jgi:hypothetical protein
MFSKFWRLDVGVESVPTTFGVLFSIGRRQTYHPVLMILGYTRLKAIRYVG